MPGPNFTAFVEARGPALLRTAVLLCAGNRAEGEDLLQAALERVLRRWASRSIDQPEAYVRKAMVNAVIRQRSRRFRELPTDAPPDRPARPGADTGTTDALRRALASLPPRQRAAVVLRYYEDLSEAETARLLGCSIGTVKSSVSRGLATLRTNDHAITTRG